MSDPSCCTYTDVDIEFTVWDCGMGLLFVVGLWRGMSGSPGAERCLIPPAVMRRCG
jgi:hypothetical protein